MSSQTQTLGSYSPEDVTVVISNNDFSHILGGFTDGVFLNVTRLIPHATLYTGADASHARVVRRVTSADVTFTLHQSSESNDILSALLRRDEEYRDNSQLFNILIKDNSGRTMYSASKAFIGTNPDADFGVEISDRAWVIHTTNMETHIGGNSEITPDGMSALEDIGYIPDSRWNPQV